MTRNHLRPQHGGNPAQGPAPDIANPDPGPGVGDDFPDAPSDVTISTGTLTDQDQPDLDKFAAKFGLLTDNNDPASDETGGAPRSQELKDRLSGTSSKVLSAISSGLGKAASRVGQIVETDTDDDATMTLVELVERTRSIRTVMVTTSDKRGTLSSRPLTVQHIDDGGDLSFIVDRNADWVTQAVEPVNVALVDGSRTWVSVAGRMLLDDDRVALEELWDPMTDSFFPDGKDNGPIVLRVQSDRWEYWTAPNRAVQLVSMAKAKTSDESPELGESGAIET
jgi:general stress protein 26